MIFKLFKSKPTLKEIIPNGFVDIHCHVLPGIDDGPNNSKQSENLITKMKNMGFSKIIATPHTYPGLHNNTIETIKNSYNKILKKQKIDVCIDYASEYLIDTYLIEKAEKKELITLKDKYVLLETSYMGAVNNLEDIIFQLRMNDYIPVIAHPERYRYLFEFKKKLFKLMDMGCKFQLNLLSTTGYYGKDIAYQADKLLGLDLIDYVGSDIHNENHIRNFDMKIKIKNLRKFEQTIKNNIFS